MRSASFLVAIGASPRLAQGLSAGLVIVALVGAAACTSFSFPCKGGSQAAPSELKDRSEMATMPAGKYLMGFANGEPDEFPAHEVQLPSFLIDRTEVTNGSYRACVQAKACREGTFDKDPILGRARHPVVGISWRDAKRYCKWVEKRLPTEAEWEYAARAPAFSIFPWEGRFKAALVNARGDVDGYDKTAPVGSFPEGRSGLGLYDMAGNVSEWVSDAYDAVYYKNSPSDSPTGPALSTGSRVVRGGSWADNDYLLRSTARAALDPNLRRDSVGFRCVAEVEGS
jgi:formylglycine-generating enzyme required for sulfatase activity